jgi:hypothetical protein
MKYYYDLHIHSNLSPCGHKDMTPNNIVNMAYIKNLDVISVTDHNICCNFPAVEKVAKARNIKVIPGIEVNTKEEVHLLCYFKNYRNCKSFSRKIYKELPKIKNREEIFGEQVIYDENDIVLGREEILLTNASNISINEVIILVKEYGGIVIPSHVGRKANGIIGVLGFIPEENNFKYIEVTDKISDGMLKKLKNKYKIIRNSDAHNLVEISERINYLELEDIEDLFL